jgi:hypothetical protein
MKKKGKWAAQPPIFLSFSSIELEILFELREHLDLGRERRFAPALQ